MRVDVTATKNRLDALFGETEDVETIDVDADLVIEFECPECGTEFSVDANDPTVGCNDCDIHFDPDVYGSPRTGEVKIS